MSEKKETGQPAADTAFWLNQFQTLATNVRWWINHGQVETATREMDAMWARWREACHDR